MPLFSTLTKVFSPSAYHNDLRKRSVFQGLGFLYLLLLVVGVIAAIYFYKLSNDRQDVVVQYRDALFQELEQFYPADLVLTWRGGELSTGTDQLRILDVKSAKLRELFTSSPQDTTEPSFEHFIAIDTHGSVDEYRSYRSVVLLTSRSAVVPDKDDRTRLVLYRDYQDSPTSSYTFDRTQWDLIARGIRPVIVELHRYYPLLVGAFVFITAIFLIPFWLIWHLLYLLIFSLVAWIFATILRRAYTYREIYLISLFGSTIPLLVSLLFTAQSEPLPKFFFSLMLLGVVGVVVVFGAERSIKPTDSPL